MKDVLDFSKMTFTEPYEYGRFRREKWVQQRRAILAEILAADPARKWTVDEMHQSMLQHPLVSRYHEHYGRATAYNDYLALREELVERRAELAGEYIFNQLDIAENIISDLYSDYQELNKIDPKDLVPEMRAQFLLNRIEKKDQLTRALERMFKRQAAIIPDVDAPKKVDVRQTSLTMTLDDFLAFKNRALSDENIIEGEIE